MSYKPNSLGKLQKKECKTLWGLAWRMTGVKSPGPSTERRRDNLQEDLGSLCCVFPVAHGACEVAFLLENQGGLEKLVHHETCDKKLAILTRKPEQNNATTIIYATYM